MIRLKSAALMLALAASLATPSAFAWYATTPKIEVLDQTVMNEPSVWSYQYTLLNQSTCFGSCSGTVQGLSIKGYLLSVREFAIPYFSDAGIFDIASPTGWTHTISTVDTFDLGFGAGTLTWSTVADDAGIVMNTSRNGFAFQTAFAPGKGPFSASLNNGVSYLGDPAIPLSPRAIEAGLLPMNAPTDVPEPQSILLMLAGLGLLAATRAARRAR